MSRLKDFVAFKAVLELLSRDNKEYILDEVFDLCKAEEEKPVEEMVNHVKKLYDLYSDDEITMQIAKLVKGDHIKPDVQIIYQTVESLHKACPNHTGDWYFTGDYPTIGGVRVVNRAFINFMRNVNARAY